MKSVTYIVSTGFDLVSGLINTLSFFLQMITEVLKENDCSGCGVSAGGLHFLSDAVIEEKNFPKMKFRMIDIVKELVKLELGSLQR